MLFSLSLNGQNLIRKGELRGSWFTSNVDSSFYNSDTIVLVKKLNKQQDDDIKKNEKEFLESESKVTDSHQYINFFFKRNKELEIGGSNLDLGVSYAWVKFEWTLKKDILTFGNNKFKQTFKVINTGLIDFETDWLLDDDYNLKHPKLPTLTLIRK